LAVLLSDNEFSPPAAQLDNCVCAKFNDTSPPFFHCNESSGSLVVFVLTSVLAVAAAPLMASLWACAGIDITLKTVNKIKKYFILNLLKKNDN
jgi:hypothetical protein